MATNPTQRTGKFMAIIAWLLGMAVLTSLFGNWEQQQANPNLNPESSVTNDYQQVSLQGNRQGHYRVRGRINGELADFLIDTGATDVVIPASLAKKYSLTSLGKGIGLTANGYVDLQRSLIQELSIGPITLYNVRASINPGMSAQQPILLGMSALARLDIQQSQGALTLTQRLAR